MIYGHFTDKNLANKQPIHDKSLLALDKASLRIPIYDGARMFVLPELREFLETLVDARVTHADGKMFYRGLEVESV